MGRAGPRIGQVGEAQAAVDGAEPGRLIAARQHHHVLSSPKASAFAVKAMPMSWNSHWPDLPFNAWNETCDTLQLWTQIAGKVRLARPPPINHWWNVTFRVNARGLVAPQNRCGDRTFDIVFDLVDHELRIARNDSRIESFALKPMP